MDEDSTGTIPSLLERLSRRGIKLRLADDDGLEVIAPKGTLSGSLRDEITRSKHDLIRWLAGARDSDGTGTKLPAIVHDEAHLYDPFPPSDLQQAFVIGSREGFEYYVRPHQYAEIEFDELDPARFEEALNKAISRQRKNLVVLGDDMRLQTIRRPEPVKVTVSDLRGMPEEKARAELEYTRMVMQREEPLHDSWPWIAPHVSIYGQGRARLHYNNNNLFADAPSGVALMNDALRYYRNAETELPELDIAYRDCVLALADLEKSDLGKKSQAYWRDRMADLPDAPNLPLVGGNEHRGRSKLSRRELTLPADLWAGLKRQAKARGVTLTSTLTAALAEVISHWSGSRHFLLNNMISRRRLPLHPQFGDVLGNFASLYPLEVDWRDLERFEDRVRRLQARMMADAEHIYWSGSKVLQELNRLRRTPGRAVCPFAVGSALFVGPTAMPSYSLLETPQTLLDTEFWELEDYGLKVTWDVIEAMFPDGLIDAMFAAYRTALTRLSQDETAWDITGFDLLPDGQREQRRRLNHSDEPLPAGLLHQPLARQAAERADAPAIITPGTVLTYAQLRDRSEHVAAALRHRGARPGDITAIVLPKGEQQVLSVLGSLISGSAYVPIDPAWPQDRIDYILSETGARAVLSSAADTGRLSTLTDVPVIAVDAIDRPGLTGGAASQTVPSDYRAAHEPGRRSRQPQDLAYVIYTSGSTGRPKGAMLNHLGPLNTITNINRRFGISPQDVVFGISSLCFDLSVYDIFGTLAAGATLVLPPGTQADPASWIELIQAHQVTVWNSVPAIMQLLVEEAARTKSRLPSLRIVLLSGDWIPVRLPGRIREVAPNARVISLGGATEGSIWSICFPIDEERDWTSIPYGKPLAHQTWHVLDELGRDAPTWVTGHLHIGGAGVAHGYLNDPAKTAASFVPHPKTGERLYRTGDLGRYLPGGEIEFLGRSDFQMKIHGFRVEPGEIEHIVLEHPDVKETVVVARDSGSGKQLVAFIVCADVGRAPREESIRHHLASRLPGYMVPSRIVVLDGLPLTANGKLDRRALEAMCQADDQRPRMPRRERTPAEEALVEIWESVLSTGPVEVDDDFFDLGGQSFAAVRMIGKIAQQFGRRVPVGTVLEHRTVAGLARWLTLPDSNWSPLVTLSEDGPGVPWFFVHPAGGNVVCYRVIADRLDAPCHAFQAPGPASGHAPLDKVKDFAELYLGALKKIRPAGPYALAGWSSGAVVALELAHRLEQAGETVEPLLVIDSPAPIKQRIVNDADLLLWFLEDLGLGIDTGGIRSAAMRDIAALPEPERAARLLLIAHEHGLPDGAIELTDFSNTLAVFSGVVRACNQYVAPKISAATVVLRAAETGVREFADHPSGAAPDWGWESLTSGRLTATVLPGTHHTLLTDLRSIVSVADVINQGSAPYPEHPSRGARKRGQAQ
jgi:pyochelin synthetase